jgi:Flp pilus assembly protein TadG
MNNGGSFSMLKQLVKSLADPSGSVALITAIGLLAVCGGAALATDIGHLVSVKSELKIAAEAGALAGARGLCTQIPASASFIDKPNWTNGNAMITDILGKNTADGHLLSSADTQVGYWNLTWHYNTAPRDSATGAITLLPATTPPNPLYVPAVRVKIDKSTGVNNGKVIFSLAKILGYNDSSSSAQAVAAVFPRQNQGILTAPAQSCFPFAIPLSWVTQHWNDDPPTSFRIGSVYHSDDGGQWTSFTLDANNVPTIRDLINNGNPTPLSVGDPIYIQPGTESTLYSDFSDNAGKCGLLPVVADDFATHDSSPIMAFVAFYVEGSGGSGNSAYVQGHFVKDYVDYDGTPGGTYNFGASAGAPALVD